MATSETVCKFNQSGFCKFLTQCRKQHVMNICPTTQCNNVNCLLRHPRVCKFFSNFGRCKFSDSCAYLHNFDKNVDDKISELESEIQKIKTKIKEVETIQLRLESLETRLNIIENASVKMSEKTKPTGNEIKMEEFELKLSQLDENFYVLVKSVDDLEKTSNLLRYNLETCGEQAQKFKCSICVQAFQNEVSMRNRIQRYHQTFKT